MQNPGGEPEVDTDEASAELATAAIEPAVAGDLPVTGEGSGEGETIDEGVVYTGTALLTVCENGYGKATAPAAYRMQTRGGKGVIAIKTSKRNGMVVGLRTVEPEGEVIIVTDGRTLLRIPVKEIRVIGRSGNRSDSDGGLGGDVLWGAYPPGGLRPALQHGCGGCGRGAGGGGPAFRRVQQGPCRAWASGSLNPQRMARSPACCRASPRSYLRGRARGRADAARPVTDGLERAVPARRSAGHGRCAAQIPDAKADTPAHGTATERERVAEPGRPEPALTRRRTRRAPVCDGQPRSNDCRHRSSDSRCRSSD